LEFLDRQRENAESLKTSIMDKIGEASAALLTPIIDAIISFIDQLVVYVDTVAEVPAAIAKVIFSLPYMITFVGFLITYFGIPGIIGPAMLAGGSILIWNRIRPILDWYVYFIATALNGLGADIDTTVLKANKLALNAQRERERTAKPEGKSFFRKWFDKLKNKMAGLHEGAEAEAAIAQHAWEAAVERPRERNEFEQLANQNEQQRRTEANAAQAELNRLVAGGQPREQPALGLLENSAVALGEVIVTIRERVEELANNAVEGARATPEAVGEAVAHAFARRGEVPEVNNGENNEQTNEQNNAAVQRLRAALTNDVGRLRAQVNAAGMRKGIPFPDLRRIGDVVERVYTEAVAQGAERPAAYARAKAEIDRLIDEEVARKASRRRTRKNRR
jgi:hypothetical protein